jgi:hypothetical protein
MLPGPSGLFRSKKKKVAYQASLGVSGAPSHFFSEQNFCYFYLYTSTNELAGISIRDTQQAISSLGYGVLYYKLKTYGYT